MSKIGPEIEGVINYGLTSLFVSSDEVCLKLPAIVDYILDNPSIQQVYISDHDAELDWNYIQARFSECCIVVTIETCKINQPLPSGVGIMLNITNGVNFDQIDMLRPTDEVKVSHGLDVISWSASSMVRTTADQFDNDVEVDIE